MTIVLTLPWQVDNPTSDDLGAGAPANFEGGKQAKQTLNDTSGVIGHNSTIESTNIDPLNENSNKGKPHQPHCW